MDRIMLIPRTLKLGNGMDRKSSAAGEGRAVAVPKSQLSPVPFPGNSAAWWQSSISTRFLREACNPNACNAIQQPGESGLESNLTVNWNGQSNNRGARDARPRDAHHKKR